jgi:hypothetical protein
VCAACRQFIGLGSLAVHPVGRNWPFETNWGHSWHSRCAPWDLLRGVGEPSAAPSGGGRARRGDAALRRQVELAVEHAGEVVRFADGTRMSVERAP